MKTSERRPGRVVLRLRALSWLLGLVPVAAACGDDEPEVDRAGLEMCCELGQYCHPEPNELNELALRECHDIGHQNDPAVCRARYDGCMQICENENPTEHACLE